MRPAQKMTEYLANINRIQGAENVRVVLVVQLVAFRYQTDPRKEPIAPSAADRPWTPTLKIKLTAAVRISIPLTQHN